MQLTKANWKELVEQGKEARETELLDYYYSKLNNDTKKEKKKRKNVMQRIMKVKMRNYSFQYIIRFFGKGIK